MSVAIVTGASVGIGAAIARRFLADGLAVFGLSRRPNPAPGVTHLHADLGDAASLSAACDALEAAIPAPTVLHLVHNAAVMPQDSARALDPAELTRALQVNVVAPSVLTARLIPKMAPGSSVIYIGSTLAEKAVSGRLTYVTSKHALVGLMRATTQDLFGAGIHTVCVCPGFTDTDMLRPLLDADPALREAVLDQVSYHRLVDPAEIADLVAFASRSPALNGALIHANLGQRES